MHLMVNACMGQKLGFYPGTIRFSSITSLFFALFFIIKAQPSFADCMTGWSSQNIIEEKERYIGVLANRGYDLCLHEWGPTADYLSDHLAPYKFNIVPLDFDELIAAVKSPESNLSYVSANPSYYTYLEYHGLARRIATLQMPGHPYPQSVFGGVIFTKANRHDISEINDLRGKHFAAVDNLSLGGWHAALREIMQAGLKPEKHFAAVNFKGTHDAVVLSVLNGQADAGTVRSTQLERMAAEGLINLDEVKIINDQRGLYPDYNDLVSTKLYPEWPFAALHNADDALSKRIALLLLMMDADDPAAIALRSAGWTVPEKYDEVHNLLRILLLPPYQDYGITLRKTINKYWPWLLSMLLLFIAAIVFGGIVFVLNRHTRKMAIQLKQSENKFRTLFEYAPVSFMIHNIHDASVIDANKKTLEAYGAKNLTELQAANIWAEPPYDYDRALALTKLTREEGPQRFEWKIRTVKGDYSWEDVTLRKVDFDDQARLISIGLDITDRKHAESQLQKSEQMFRNLSENLSVGVAMISKDMEVLMVNPRMQEWFPHGEYNHCPKCYQVFNKQPRQNICDGCPVAKTLLDGEIHFHERKVETHEGVRYLAITATAIKDENDNITAAIEMADDITERKQTEIILKEAKQQAEVANKAKSEFLANMSHEIRTPLNGVIGFTDLLKKTNLTETQQLYVANANTSAHSLLAIINDILDLSKIEADKLELDLIKTDIIELTEQAADIIKFHAAEKKLELLLNIQPGTPRYAMVDPVRLKQILVNLLSNAVKFTEKGEVELKLCFEPLDNDHANLTFSVRDTGIGISEKDQERIFEVFMQADTSTTRRYGGSGLGLPISGLLALKMGSTIDVNSQIGKGSEFQFTIKTTCDDGELLLPAELTDIKRVLVVDDNENNRLILQHTFEHWNISCTATGSGQEAIDIIKKAKGFDVIIMDYHMPDMNGLETIRKIREEIGLAPAKQPIILLHSSADDPSVFKECKTLGVRFNITKPVKSQELMQYLKNLKKMPKKDETDQLRDKEKMKASGVSQASPLILIVEDVEMNIVLIKALIKKTLPKARYLEAYDGQEAIQIYLSNKPELILMDVQMPVLDGLEATRQLRQIEKDADKRTPIIALTARAMKGESEKCFEAGMDDFLSKPINQGNLGKLLKKYFN